MNLPILKVPSWAEAMIGNYRRQLSLPASVTDEMIFARLEECRGMEQSDIEDSVRDLVEEEKNQ